MESKAAIRAKLAQPLMVAYDDGEPILVPVPVATIPADSKQERRVRWQQKTLTSVRPKPGHDGGTPTGVFQRKAIVYSHGRTMWPGKCEVDDALDKARSLYGDYRLFRVTDAPDRALILRLARWYRHLAETGLTGKARKKARIPWGAAILRAAYRLNAVRLGVQA